MTSVVLLIHFKIAGISVIYLYQRYLNIGYGYNEKIVILCKNTSFSVIYVLLVFSSAFKVKKEMTNEFR